MKSLSKIQSELYLEPWLITEARHSARREAVKARLDGAAFEIDKEDPVEATPFGSFLVIPVYGVIGQHLDRFEVEYFGGCDLDAINSAIGDAKRDDSINTVVFDFRTPGGSVTGIPETAVRILELSQTFGKNTVAFTDSQCCSGGLYLAEQCDRFYTTSTARVGSCGVYSIYVEYTRMLSDQGIKVNAISAGEFKLAGAYFKEMTDAEKTMFLTRVQKIHAEFKEAVQSVRNVDPKYLEGQVFDGQEAVDIGMCDEVVGSFEELQDILNAEQEG